MLEPGQKITVGPVSIPSALRTLSPTKCRFIVWPLFSWYHLLPPWFTLVSISPLKFLNWYCIVEVWLGCDQDITNMEATWDLQKPCPELCKINEVYHGDRPYHSSFRKLLSDPWMLINTANSALFSSSSIVSDPQNNNLLSSICSQFFHSCSLHFLHPD